MNIALIYDACFPVAGYGGTERVVWWLAKGLSEQAHQVHLLCRSGSSSPFGPVHALDFSRFKEPSLPKIDLYHYFATPPFVPSNPYLVTIGGNGKMGESYLSNTVFVSRNHAQRHGSEQFVYNGIDPIDYQFTEKKDRYWIFLAKASWKVKNVRGAIELAKQSKQTLRIVGGKKLFNLNPHIRWEGVLGGGRKAALLSRACGLLFPVIWNEPFGLVVVEALISGTPVVASRRGSLPELIPAHVGALCDTQEEFLLAMENPEKYKASECRQWVMEKFHYRQMAAAYIEIYKKILDGEILHAIPPKATEPPQLLLPF
ncbi:MAG: glycosyltransferase [Deltaproteobacteria bacterium]|nr:glycosyltransferase [Deltaproteobacteria bacterium]